MAKMYFHVVRLWLLFFSKLKGATAEAQKGRMQFQNRRLLTPGLVGKFLIPARIQTFFKGASLKLPMLELKSVLRQQLQIDQGRFDLNGPSTACSMGLGYLNGS